MVGCGLWFDVEWRALIPADTAWRRAVSTAELVSRNWPSEVGCGLYPRVTGGPFAGYEEEFPMSGVSRDCMLVTGTWNRTSGHGVVSTAESHSDRL